ncbi:DUF1488 family protein [Paraburkholderia sp. 5N]|uniref:DUF1488 family protein n=1 Tax=Paraburkholderia elongata TaxID=2675747 RepID=A0A972NPJ1_9BURK|nr:DUF1488 family protein [Paraburkholderia elongata]
MLRGRRVVRGRPVSGSIIKLLARSGGSNACEIESTTDGCAITAEALEDHFGAHSALESALMAAFDNGRNRIRSVCAEAIDQNGGKGVVLHSGLFRVDGMEPDRGTTA